MMTAPLEKAVEALRSHLTAPGALMPEDLVQAGLPGTAHAMRLALALLAAIDADKMVMMVREQADELESCAAAMRAAGTELDSLRLALAEAERQRDEATDTALRHLTERDDWFAAYQRAEALRLEAVQGMVAAERERDEARAEASAAMERLRGLTARALAAEALSRARETEDVAVREAAEEIPANVPLATAISDARDALHENLHVSIAASHGRMLVAMGNLLDAITIALSSPPRPETKDDNKGGAA